MTLPLTLTDYLTTENGPNVSTSSMDLFESDASIAKRAARLARGHSQAGSPIRLNNKLLCLSEIQLTGDMEPKPWAVVGDAAGLARKVDLATGQTLTAFRGHGGPVSALLVTFLPCSESSSKSSESLYVLTGCWDQKIRVFDVHTGECLVVVEQGHSDYVNCLLYEPWSQVLVSAGADSRILVWSIDKSATALRNAQATCPFSIVKTIRTHTRSIEAALFSMGPERDGDGNGNASVSAQSPMRLWTASSDTTVRCHAMPGGQPVLPTHRAHPLPTAPLSPVKEQGHLTSVYCLAASPDSTSIYSGSADQRIIEWDAESGAMVEEWEFEDWIKSLVISSDEHESRYLFAGSREGYLFVLDRTSNEVVQRITQGHADEITSMKVSRGVLYTASLDGTLRRWPIHDLVHESVEAVAVSVSSTTSCPAAIPERPSGLTVEEEAELALLMAEDQAAIQAK